MEGIKQQSNSLPPVINVHDKWFCHLFFEYQLLQFWSTWSSKLPSFEVGLYEIKRVPINLYPSIPLMKVKFGPAAIPPLIKLADHGILGLQYDTFHFTDYDHYGEVRHSITALYYGLNAVKKHHFNHISNLYSVSNVDFHDMDIDPSHLEQLSIACPNLERVNLMNTRNCLQNLKGLQALVNKCKNLQGINLDGIPISSVECHLFLWELLSSVKKLTHLAIDLSMLKNHGNFNDAGQQKFIGLLKNCSILKALEVTHEYSVGPQDLLFSHFPSLVYVRLEVTMCNGSLEYTITNCHQLKYLYYYNSTLSIRQISLPLSSSCHLQQLYMRNIGLSAASVHVLSAHGGLEQVILYDVRITTSAITTLISNSPNLILLHIILVDYTSLNMEDYKNTISETFSNHKLFTVGDFFTNLISPYNRNYHSNLISLWNIS